MRRFFIHPKEISNPTPALSDEEARHIKNVLRLKQGDNIRLFDGSGREYDAEIITLSNISVEVSILHRIDSIDDPPVEIDFAQAFLKARKMDLLVKQLTELGISKWIPFIAKRSVPKPDTKHLFKRTERWKKIVLETLKQSNRSRFTEIGETVSFKDIFGLAPDYDLKIVFWENESKPLHRSLSSYSNPCRKILAVMGPEGGFTPDEIEAARGACFLTASLGPRTLRAETASLVACTLLQYLFGDMGKIVLTKMPASNTYS
jgi:16S rRNA (uracil1498-N3)-methyltransferase